MRGGSLIFLLLIPALIALGHDTYLFYINIVEPKGFTLDLLLSEFKFSALGFIWTTYSEDSYKSMFETSDPETWATIDYLLTFKAFFVGLGFAAAITFLLALPASFGIGPFANENGRVYASDKSKKSVSFRSGQNKNKIDFKRK